jgi:glutamate-1-semialdehyde 2,1-aminomutase
MSQTTAKLPVSELPARGSVDAVRADDLLPGGGVNARVYPGGAKLVIARGEGPRVWDVDGNEYIDYVLGSGPLILGHAHPAVLEAVQRQLPRGSTFYALTESTLELAERIVKHVPCAEMVQFCTSGSESTFYALRLARAATGRDAVLKFEGGYHGANDYSVMSLSPVGASDFPRGEPSSAGVPAAVARDVLVAPYNDLAAVEHIVEEHGASLAAIIVEPIQRIIDPQPGFLEGLRRLATRRGIVLIFDEVVTGFRMAPGGAQELYGVTPDLATLGKIIGGGFALAAVCGPSELLSLATPGRAPADGYVFINGTLNGNPVATAAGLATIEELMQPGTYERLNAVGERIRTALRKVAASAGIDAQVLGTGPLFQVALTSEPVVDYRSMKRADAKTMQAINIDLLRLGVFTNGEKGYLSLAHGFEELDQTAAMFADALEENRAAAT